MEQPNPTRIILRDTEFRCVNEPESIFILGKNDVHFEASNCVFPNTSFCLDGVSGSTGKIWLLNNKMTSTECRGVGSSFEKFIANGIDTTPTAGSQNLITSGAVKAVEDKIPNVPSWVLENKKPSYDKSDVGLENVDNVKQYSASNPPPYPVTKVNGQTGEVTIPIPTVPTKVSQLENDSKFLTSIPSEYVTDTKLSAKGYLTLSTLPKYDGGVS